MSIVSLGVVPSKTSFGFALKNGSATLCDGNKIVVSIAEERLSRKKCAPGSQLATEFISTQILGGDLPETVVISSCCEPANAASLDEGSASLFLQNKVLRSPSHHFSHALMSYYLSPYDRAILAVVDAGGNTLTSAISNEWWKAPREQATFYLAEGNSIVEVHSCFRARDEWGLGEAYRAFTKFLGLGGQTHSGKTMGLAAFSGTPFEAELFVQLPDGRLHSNLACSDPWHAIEGVESFLLSNGIQLFRRQSAEPLLEAHAAIASLVQEATRKALVHVLTHLVAKFKVRHICVSGGVGLNVPANTSLLDISGVESVFIPPCPGDDGQSIGNALLPLHRKSRKRRPTIEFRDAFFGPERPITREAILSALVESTADLEITEDTDDYRISADLISRGSILGWFQGRSEIGPRALGHRSILADPRRRESRHRITRWIKGRETFRPYAATVIGDEASAWFELGSANPFMLFIGRMRPQTQKIAPALFHPDKTCRVQTINGEAVELEKLLRTFKRLTGLPFLLNTSLNTAGMPLAETVSEAIAVLEETDLDGLVIGNYVLQKKRRVLPPDLMPVSEIGFAPGDRTAEFRLNLLYPGLQVTKRTYFGLQREYCDWILLGRKRTTIRYSAGAIDLPTDSTIEVMARPGGEVVYAVDVLRVRVLPFGSLSYQDARADGFGSLRELKDTLQRFYGAIHELHPVSIYEVDVMAGFEGLRGRTLSDR